MREKFAKKLVTRGCNFGTKELYYPQWDFSERGGLDARAERLGGVNTTEWTHCPVLLEECLQGLRIRPDGVYVDGTLGRAGHARRIAGRLTEGGRLIAIDQDQAALDAAPDRFGELLGRVTLVRRNFRELPAVLDELGIAGVDGVLLDLGVSSPQLDDASRGFSYRQDAPLDMRMDQSAPLTAADVVNTYDYAALRDILSRYGEERCAPQIAAAIVRRREHAPIRTTLELVEVIRSAMPARALRERQHPAKRSFQALRIAVNDELGAIAETMEAVIPRLNPLGRLCVITFHSLEDRIVKTAMADAARGCICPPEFPVCVCGRSPQVRLVTRKPVTPSPEELEHNPRARSAKLRVCEKCRSGATT